MAPSNHRATANIGWREEPEMPRSAEIMATTPAVLLDNRVDVPPGDKARYSEAQFRMLRYEGTERLRRAVQEFREDPDMMESQGTAIYTNVVVHGYLVTGIGALCRIGFCPSRVEKRIRWNHSPRLTPGTIVALSTKKDNFKSVCMVASVVQKELTGGLEPGEGEHPHTPPRIDIAWADPQDAVLDPNTELIMIEARNGYYESVRYAMQGLQNWSQYPSIFERYLIDGKLDGRAPRYMTHLGHTVDLSSIVTDTTTGNGPDPRLRHVGMKSEIPPAVTNSTGLDVSQLNALRHVFTSELAVVQGPPGTGKTFTSISALQILLSNIDCSKHPIIIAAQTNHALDQILLLLGQATKMDFVRVGGRSQNEHIASRTLYNLRKRSRKNHGGRELNRIDSRKKTHTAVMKDLVSDCFPEDLLNPSELLANELITQAQYDSLGGGEGYGESPFKFWLDVAVEPCAPHRFNPTSNTWEEVEDPDAHNDRTITTDDDDYRLSGTYIPISEKQKGRVNPKWVGRGLRERARKMLDHYQDLWCVKREFRGAVYQCLRDDYMEVKSRDFRMLLEEKVQLTCDGNACRATSDAKVIQEFKVPIVGCTTTGLTKYRKLIENLEPRVMLIEEAAETREANITSALFPSLEQLILVGDHMQLAPHTDLPELSRPPYNFSLSLFERMVNLKMGHAVLNVQRRMIPEIRRIIKPFYPTLTDHESVLDKTMRPPVPGMGAVSSYFFCHRWPERRTVQRSIENVDEARMVTGFMKHLMQNGTPAFKITILTFYRGQKNLLLEQLRRDAVLTNLNPTRKYTVCTVDGYQGEENDVVILSLVRCPGADHFYNVGFLDNQNRVVVALSRARRGFYVFGSYINLMKSGDKAREVWKPSMTVMNKNDRVHSTLPLECKRHGTVVKVKDPQEWESLHGGCRAQCATRLECGHECRLLCHPYSHSAVRCRQPCDRPLPCGHGCSKLCSEQCRCGQGKCSYVPEAPKKSTSKFQPLAKFLKEDEEEGEEAPPVAVADVEPDLISWGEEDDVPSMDPLDNWASAAVNQVGGASPDSSDLQGSSETASEKSRHLEGIETDNTTPDASPITPRFSSDCHGDSSLSGSGGQGSGFSGSVYHGSCLTGGDVAPARSWCDWDPKVEDSKTSRGAEKPRASRERGQVFNETFHEVRVNGYQREAVRVHHTKNVQARAVTTNGGPRMDSPEPVGEPVKSPPSPAELLEELITIPASSSESAGGTVRAPRQSLSELMGESSRAPMLSPEPVRETVNTPSSSPDVLIDISDARVYSVVVPTQPFPAGLEWGEAAAPSTGASQANESAFRPPKDVVRKNEAGRSSKYGALASGRVAGRAQTVVKDDNTGSEFGELIQF